MKTTEELAALAKDMLTAYVCPDLKAAAEKYIDAPTDENALALKAVLPECIATIDDAVGFAQSDYCKEKFGEDGAAGMLKATLARKAAGEKYCDCPGCTKALALLDALR